MALGAALLAGGAVAVLGYLGLRALGSWRTARVDRMPKGAARQPEDRIGEWLAAVRVPGFWGRLGDRADLQQRITKAGLPWSPNSFHALRWLAFWVAILLAIVLALRGALDFLRIFLSIMLLASALAGPAMLLRIRSDRRRRLVERSLPDFLDRMTLGLEAGLGFEVALRRASSDFGSVLGDELRRVVRLLDLGRTKGAVLDELAGRIASEDLRGFATSVKQSERLGTSLAKTLRVQSEILRARRRRRAQEASRRLPVLVVFPLVFFFLPALLIIYLAPPLLHLFLR